MFTVEMLDAYEGDALWIEYGHGNDVHRVLIDAGRKRTYRELEKRIVALAEPLELFVMTHIDDDHIFGAIPLFSDRRTAAGCFKDVWYNGFTHLEASVARRPAADVLGPKNGEIFAALLLAGGYPWNEAFDGGATVVVPDAGELPVVDLEGGLRLTLLSPTWAGLEALEEYWSDKLEDFEPGDAAAALEIFAERRSLQPDVLGGTLDVEGLVERDYEADPGAPNGSSIALLAEYGERAVLFAGDAHPPVLEASIRRLLDERGGAARLKVDAFKVSHHGSKKNTSVTLLDLLDCRRYLISTNGSRHRHPDRETVARIVYGNRHEPAPTELYFNFRSDETEPWDDEDLRDEWNYRTFYPPQGRLVDLSE